MQKEVLSKKIKRDWAKQGRRNKINGALFEKKVREDLESKEYIITKWMNNVDFEKGKIVPAKRKYNPFMKVMVIGTGFPDFVCFKKANEKQEVIGIEVKTKGLLDKEEREKSRWYIMNKIFSKILIAKKEKEGRKIKIKYIDFQDKYGDKK